MLQLISDFSINLSNHHLIIDIVPAYDILCSDSEEMLVFFEEIKDGQNVTKSEGFVLLVDKIRRDTEDLIEYQHDIYLLPVEDRKYPVRLILDIMLSYFFIAWLFAFNDIYISEEFYDAISD